MNKTRGFTLLEVMFAVSLMSLLLLGSATLFVTALRTAGRTHAQVVSSASAANALTHVMGDAREAYYLDLPTDAANDSPGTFTLPAGRSLSDFISGGTSTAVQMTFPATAARSVLRSDGLAQALATPSYAVAPGFALLLYRSDGSGAPRPADGHFLWAVGMARGGTAPINPVATLCDAGSTPPPDAVQFTRVHDGTGAVVPGQMEAKIVAVSWSLIGGSQGSESSTAALTGKCVFMRNRGN